MIYIKKEGLPDNLKSQIIELQKNNEWKNIQENDTESIRHIFDDEFPKNDIKKVLIHEQKGLCAYCMRRIHMDSHSRIEHLIPLSKDKEKAIDYNNMLGVCDGGERKINPQNRVLCCDAHKKEIEITISPLNSTHMKKIAYKVNGIIYTNPKDEVIERDINEVLLLNGIRKKDGTVRDTATELLKGRRDAYTRARKMMERLNKNGKCTSATLKKLIDSMLDQEELEEYIGVKLYYLKKKYESLVRRGL